MASKACAAVQEWLNTLSAEYGDEFTVQLKRDGSGRIKHSNGTDTFGCPEAAIGPVATLRYRITLSNEWNLHNLSMTITCRNRQEGIEIAESQNPGWTFVRARKLKVGEE